MNVHRNHEFRSSDHPRKFKNHFVLKCLKYVPIFTLGITVSLFILTVCLLASYGKDTFVFIFLSAEVYINWIAILFTRGKLDGSDSAQTTSTSSSSVTLQRVWFCTKCRVDTFYECHHCPLCEVCIVQRDHHCFFLGTCITRQNMKHFIVLCMYTTLTCFYIGFVLVSHVALRNPALYLLPVAIGHYISGSIHATTVCQVLIIDIVFAVGCITTCFGCYQVAIVCLATLPYSYEIEKSNGIVKNLLCAFEGPCGLLNFIFPISLSCKKNNTLSIINNKLV